MLIFSSNVSLQGAQQLDDDVAEAMGRFATLLRGANAASVTSANYKFLTPEMLGPIWQASSQSELWMRKHE